MLIIVTTWNDGGSFRVISQEYMTALWDVATGRKPHDVEHYWSLLLSFCFCWKLQKCLSIDVLTFATPIPTSIIISLFMLNLSNISALEQIPAHCQQETTT